MMLYNTLVTALLLGLAGTTLADGNDGIGTSIETLPTESVELTSLITAPAQGATTPPPPLPPQSSSSSSTDIFAGINISEWDRWLKLASHYAAVHYPKPSKTHPASRKTSTATTSTASKLTKSPPKKPSKPTKTTLTTSVSGAYN
jgi:hypothetical protein